MQTKITVTLDKADMKMIGEKLQEAFQKTWLSSSDEMISDEYCIEHFGLRFYITMEVWQKTSSDWDTEDTPKTWVSVIDFIDVTDITCYNDDGDELEVDFSSLQMNEIVTVIFKS